VYTALDFLESKGKQLMVINLPDAQATQALGQALGEQLPAGSVLLLQGELGSGKTTLVQGLGLGLGVADIDSPTFTLINEYLSGRVPLYHIDLYRLSPEEADALFLENYWDALEVEPGIVAIEWSERLRHLPLEPIVLSLSYLPQGRQATLVLPTSLSLNFGL
jgi:tRNA threonylcarbamoyladenosine biosynthesis protein TsaE